jgi:hypothetical protein
MQTNLKLKLLISLIIFWVFVFVGENVMLAVTTGKISGRVYDAENKQPLAGANISIEGTMMGAAANHLGEYFIINVPPGKYNVAAKMMGYEILRFQDVLVQIGLTTSLDFSLHQTAIAGKEVVVIAGRPVIQTDVASGQTILQGSEIAAIPVSNFKQALDKQVGIQEVDGRGLFMRGQRQFAISLLVDGFETRENLDDQVYTRFNPDELEQVEINASGYDASYGNASAGVITLVSKEGGEKYSLTFDYRQSTAGRKHFGPPIKYYYDEYFLNGWENNYVTANWKPALSGNAADTLATIWESRAHLLPRSSPYRDRPELLKELYQYRMRDEVAKYGDKPDGILSATFGGPVPFIKNLTLFSSFRREKDYYLYPGVRDNFFDQNGMFKLTFHPTTNMKLVFNTRYTETTGCNRYDYYLYDEGFDFSSINPDFQSEKRYLYESVEQVAYSGYSGWPYVGWVGVTTHIRNQHGLTLTHTLSSRTFYEVKLLVNNFRANGGMVFRDTSQTVTLIANRSYPATQGAGQDSVVLSGADATAPLDYWPLGFRDPGTDITMAGEKYSEEHNYSKDFALRFNLTSQINRTNQINAGFQYNYYDIKKSEDRIEGGGGFRDDDWKWHVYPQSFSFWANDKLEFEGMVLNVGLRGDVRIPDRWLDWRNHPWDYHWSDVVPPDSNWSGQRDNNWAGPKYDPPIKVAIAPRLGISHPIGENAKLFFNWGHYYQEPPFERQYMYYTRGGDQVGSGSTTYGDPELPFIKSVQYEIGYEHNLLNMFRIAASGYYKDVKNLLAERIRYNADNSRRTDGLAPRYWTFGANRYESTQGFEARLEKRIGRFWTAWFNFNYEVYSRGVQGYQTFYEDTTQAPGKFDYADENRKRAPESRFNIGADIHTPSQFGPKFLGFHPAADMNLNFLLWWRQQPAFTYNAMRLTPPYDPRDNMRWVPHWSVNMTFTKRFDFKSFITPVFYVEIYNLLNTKNMFRGSFDESNRLSVFEQYLASIVEAGAQPGERADLAEEAIGNLPANTDHVPLAAYVPFALYLNPRQIWFGVRFEIK